MPKKRYILIGSVALLVTLLGTTVLILAARNAFDGAANQEANLYNRLPLAKFFSQAMGLEDNNKEKIQENTANLAKADQLMGKAAHMASNKNYEVARDLYAQSLASLQQYPGLDCIQAVSALTEKARCEHQLGLEHERESTLRTLVDASAKAYNDRHELVAAALESLGDLLCNEGRQREALPFLERACDIRIKGAGLDSGDTACAISQLAHCNLDLKNYKQADDLYNEAIAIYQKLDGDGFSESQQIARENLANSYCWQNRYKDALAEELAMLEDLENKKLGNSYNAASTLTSAACTAQRQNDRKRMHQFLDRAQRIAGSLDQVEDGAKRAALYSDIADAYNDGDDFKDELAARQHSLESYKSLKYPQEDDQVQLAQNLVKAGSCALKLKDFNKAHDYFGQALSQARDNRQIRLKLKANKEEIQEYLKYIEKDKRADQDAAIKMQASKLKQMLVS